MNQFMTHRSPSAPRFALALALTGALGIPFAACSRTSKEDDKVVVVEMLPSAKPKQDARPGTNKDSEYVSRFDSADEARAHADAVRAQGGSAAPLDDAGRILSVRAPNDVLGTLRVPASTLIAENTRLRLRPRAPGTIASFDPRTADAAAAAFATQESFSVQEAVGLNALRARVKGADGAGMRVAVLDTGIDFGIPGLSLTAEGTAGKLVGFHDLTPFGRVRLSEVNCTVGPKPCASGALSLGFDGAFAGARITGLGTLDERAQANRILGTEGDFNANGTTGDVITVARGMTANGTEAVWIDLDGNGTIDGPDREQLTDFNTTGAHLAAHVTQDSGGATVRKGRIAVTIKKDMTVQFHSVSGMHGTGVATIIAGEKLLDGRLDGLAPKAELLSYVIDANGNDGYQLDTLLAMFLDAKKRGATAVNASWGFATADLPAARFMADVLDKELTQQGVLVAIAAGNAGPAVGTAASDDYIPRWGFGLAASLSARQARDVYGYTGDVKDTVVDYSSVGPTRGGRLVPDLTSPLISLVRSARNSARAYTPFSGTSSATPAFVGAATSLMSALRQTGHDQIDMRLLKRALLSTARPFEGVESVRQGAGLVDVNRAYDAYLAFSEQAGAFKSGQPQPGLIPYNFKVQLVGSQGDASMEGLRVNGFVPNAAFTLTAEFFDGLAPSDRAVDGFSDVVRIMHSGAFIESRSLMPVQLGENVLNLSFKASVLQKPGIYSDVIQVRRERDDALLASIPVVLTIPHATDNNGTITTLDEALPVGGLARTAIELKSAGPVQLKASVRTQGRGVDTRVSYVLSDRIGRSFFSGDVATERGAAEIDAVSEALPAGVYELTLHNGGTSFNPTGVVRLLGDIALPVTRVTDIARTGTSIQIAMRSFAPATSPLPERFAAALQIDEELSTLTLKPSEVNGIPGYLSEAFRVQSGSDGSIGSIGGIRARLSQGLYGESSEGFLELAVALLSKPFRSVLDWTWLNVHGRRGTAGSVLSGASTLSVPAGQDVQVFAYANVGRLETAHTPFLTLDYGQSAGRAATKVRASEILSGSAPHALLATFEIPEAFRTKGLAGRVVLIDEETQDEVFSLPVAVASP